MKTFYLMKESFTLDFLWDCLSHKTIATKHHIFDSNYHVGMSILPFLHRAVRNYMTVYYHGEKYITIMLCY